MEEFSMASVLRRADGSLQICPDGDSTPLQKSCLFPAGLAPAEGDRLLLLRFAGCRLVIARYPKA